MSRYQIRSWFPGSWCNGECFMDTYAVEAETDAQAVDKFEALHRKSAEKIVTDQGWAVLEKTEALVTIGEPHR